jgi:two-component system, chemotaxis family, chemotaxis protein CheY
MTHILIVDDQVNVRTAVLQLLLSCNCSDLNVDQVTNGTDALRKLQSRYYDLMIADTDMPGMNGAELMHAVRADDKLKSLPVIMLLAVGAGKKDVLDAVALGISGFVIKPFRPDPLLIQIKKVLGW